MKKINSAEIKDYANKLGADLVGISSADVLNSYPPDPNWPQTPARIWKECRSVIVLAKRIPWGVFRADDRTAKLYPPHQVMQRLDQISLDMVYFLEDQGCHAFPVPQQFTDTKMKRGSYGSLSLRHAAVEAGLGTLGLNLNLITPQFGPRVYLSAVLVDIDLDPDPRLTKRQCLGISCARCLLACPADAIEHWGINKRSCSTEAQPFGISSIIRFISHLLKTNVSIDLSAAEVGTKIADFWQALRVGPGAYAGCLHCMEVCPVGQDYRSHMSYMGIPVSESKKKKKDAMYEQEKDGQSIAGLEKSRRWIGEG
ncbi:MAG: hypothetical protein AB1556_16965 [Bacillota bacterium]